jgi:hypothetical protein
VAPFLRLLLGAETDDDHQPGADHG